MPWPHPFSSKPSLAKAIRAALHLPIFILRLPSSHTPPPQSRPQPVGSARACDAAPPGPARHGRSPPATTVAASATTSRLRLHLAGVPPPPSPLPRPGLADWPGREPPAWQPPSTPRSGTPSRGRLSPASTSSPRAYSSLQLPRLAGSPLSSIAAPTAAQRRLHLVSPEDSPEQAAEEKRKGDRGE
uniref:Uncharacterized protein n=1 Tax=Oryza meridionalis TaxID=40149 RepID=A0A0E0ERM8_9ORYZ